MLDSERAARKVQRDLSSIWEQERSESPLGLVYPRQVTYFSQVKRRKPKHRYFDIMLTYNITFLDPQVSAVMKFATCLVDFARSRDHLFERQLGASGAGFRSRRLQTQRRQQREA